MKAVVNFNVVYNAVANERGNTFESSSDTELTCEMKVAVAACTSIILIAGLKIYKDEHVIIFHIASYMTFHK